FESSRACFRIDRWAAPSNSFAIRNFYTAHGAERERQRDGYLMSRRRSILHRQSRRLALATVVCSREKAGRPLQQLLELLLCIRHSRSSAEGRCREHLDRSVPDGKQCKALY